jgi:hypothetical protein
MRYLNHERTDLKERRKGTVLIFKLKLKNEYKPLRPKLLKKVL